MIVCARSILRAWSILSYALRASWARACVSDRVILYYARVINARVYVTGVPTLIIDSGA